MFDWKKRLASSLGLALVLAMIYLGSVSKRGPVGALS